MNAIYDRQGITIAWLGDKHIYDLFGNQVLGFIKNDAIFSFRTGHLGRFKKGFFRDKGGNAVAFIRGATGGPVTPVTRVSPISPIPSIPPISPTPPIPSIHPTDSFSWSNLTWEQFMNN